MEWPRGRPAPITALRRSPPLRSSVHVPPNNIANAYPPVAAIYSPSIGVLSDGVMLSLMLVYIVIIASVLRNKVGRYDIDLSPPLLPHADRQDAFPVVPREDRGLLPFSALDVKSVG